MKELVPFGLEQLGGRYARPTGDHSGNELSIHGLGQERTAGLGFFQPVGGLHQGLLGLGQLTEADGTHALKLSFSFGLVGLGLQGLDQGLSCADRSDQLLLPIPTRTQGAGLFVQAAEFGSDGCEATLSIARLVFLQCPALDLQLAQAAFDAIQLGRHGVDGRTQLGSGLVHAVDGLVGHEAVVDVAIRKSRGRHQGGVLDAHAVVHLVALLQATQDGDRVFDGGLAGQHGKEAALQGGVLLDVLLVLVQGRGPDAVQVSPGQGRLEHIGRVHGSLRSARTHQGVELVDEQNHLAVCAGDLLQDGLQALFELAPVLGTRQERAHIQRHDALALDSIGHVAGHDAVGQAFDDGGLAHTGVPDEDRVVLAPARENLHHAANLLITADDGVELSGFGFLGQIGGVLLEGFKGGLGILARDTAAPAHLSQGGVDLLGRDATRLEEAHGLRVALADESQEQVFGRDELVAHLLCGLASIVQDQGQRL